MKYVSTRDRMRTYTAAEAIVKGISDDGGLIVPSSFPVLDDGKLDALAEMDYPERAASVLAEYLDGFSYEELLDYARKAYSRFDGDDPCPLVKVDDGLYMLELWHGPTFAFKDMALTLLPHLMVASKRKLGDDSRTLVLVATSGDTGGAVASAFHGRKHLSVKVLFPKGRVAERQRKQLTCWDGNVESYEVDGSFDDCQAMVKAAFMDPVLKDGLSSANSINLGRLLPQMVYYVYASMRYEEVHHKKPVVIIPSGNVGNCTGAYWAKEMGAPIARIVLAVNANRTIPDYLEEGVYRPRPSVRTLANAMDVGAPSNMERIFDLYRTVDEVRANLSAWSVCDDEIRKTIQDAYHDEGYIMCPHTACAEHVRRSHFADRDDVLIVSTAHPAKFETIVEPLLGLEVPLPESLSSLLDRKSVYRSIGTDWRELFS